MNPFQAVLTAIERSETGMIGVVSVRGALVRVRLDLVREASIGDLLLVDAGVAVALLARGHDHHPLHVQEAVDHVSGNSR
jgi:hydrogenase maturation factor